MERFVVQDDGKAWRKFVVTAEQLPNNELISTSHTVYETTLKNIKESFWPYQKGHSGMTLLQDHERANLTL